MSDLLLHARMRRVRGQRNFKYDREYHRERLAEAIRNLMHFMEIKIQHGYHTDFGNAGFFITARTDITDGMLKRFLYSRQAYASVVSECVNELSRAIITKLLDSGISIE